MRNLNFFLCAAALVLVLAGSSVSRAAIESRDILRTFFETGDVPTQEQFGSLIDSLVHYSDDRYLIGLREYDPSVSYVAGDIKRFGIGDTAPAGPLGYVLPGSGSTIQMAPDFAGHFGFAAMLFTDPTGSNLYYGFMQLEMDAATPSPAGLAIHVQYIGIETVPNTPITMEALPEPASIGAIGLMTGAALLRRKRN